MKWKSKKSYNKLSLPKGTLVHFPKHKRSGFKFVGQKKWYSPSKNIFSKINYASWLWVIASGLLMSFSLPSAYNKFAFARSFLAWFALAPLFCILWNSKNYFDSFAKCFIAGLSLNLICFRFLLGIHPLDWMGVPHDLSLMATLSGWLIAALQQAFYWGIYGILFRLVHTTLSTNQWSALQFSLIWVVWQEKIANAVFLGGIPWTSLYYSQAGNLPLMQTADFVGGSGISFLIIFANIVLAQLWLSLGKKNLINESTKVLSMSVQYIVLLTFCLIYGFIHLFGIGSECTNSKTCFKALALQKNLSISETRYINQGQQVQAFTQLLQKVKGKPDLILIPEGTLKQSLLPKLTANFKQISPSSNIIAGAYLTDKQKQNFNTAIGIVPNHEQNQIYYKQILVPFGEYTPLESAFTMVLKLFKLDYLTQNSFSKGTEAQSFKMSFGNIAPLICFEALSPEIANKQVKAGAQAIAVIGDSSWFRNYQNLVASQMLAAAQVRAIESRRSVLVNINKGPLLSVDKFGRVQKYAKDSEFIFFDFSLNSKQSFFTRIQW